MSQKIPFSILRRGSRHGPSATAFATTMRDSQIRAAAPFFMPGKDGTQIDLLIQTDEAMYVVEVKRRKIIDSGIIDEVKEKVRAMRKPRGVSIRKGVIYEGELSPAVKRSGYFDAIVDIESFLRD